MSFKLTVDRPDGRPAVGYSVRLRRGSGGTQDQGAIQRDSDAKGQADFGVIQPGDWEYRVGSGGWQATGSLNAVPGTMVRKAIVCPKSPPDKAPVKIRVAWPAELADKNLSALLRFVHTGITYEEPLHWSLSSSVNVLWGPEDETVETSFTRDSARFWRFRRKSETGQPFAFPSLRGTTPARDQIYVDLDSTPDMAGTSPIEVDAGSYSLEELIVLHPGGPPRRDQDRSGDDSDPDARRFEVVASLVDTGQELMVHVVDESPNGTKTSMMQQFMRGLTRTRSAHPIPDRFEALPGKTAEWTIPVPEELVKMIDRKLKADK